MDSVTNAKRHSGGLEFNPEPFTIVIDGDSDTPDPVPINRTDSSKTKPQASNLEALDAANLEKLARQSSKPQHSHTLLERLSEKINPDILNAQKLSANQTLINTNLVNKSKPETPVSQKQTGIVPNQLKMQIEDFKKINSQQPNKADSDKPQTQKNQLPEAKKPVGKSQNAVVICLDEQSDEETPQMSKILASSGSNLKPEVKGEDKRQLLGSKIVSGSPVADRLVAKKSSLPNETANGHNFASKLKAVKEDTEQRVQKKPAATRVRLENKIQNLQGMQGSTKDLNPVVDPIQNAINGQKAMNDYSNASLAGSLYGLGHSLEQAATMKPYLNMLQHQNNYNPLQQQMQFLLNSGLQNGMSSGYVVNPEYLRLLQYFQLMQQQSAQPTIPHLNPLTLNTSIAQEMTKSKNEQEKPAQVKPQLVKESSNKPKNTGEIRPAEIIHIVDDETDKEESKPMLEQQKAKSLLSKNNLARLAAEKDKTIKPIFQIKQLKPNTRQQKAAQSPDSKQETKVVKRKKQPESEAVVKKQRVLPKQTEKKSNEQLKAKGEDDPKEEPKEGDANPLEENLEINKKKIRAVKQQQQGPLFSTYLTEKNNVKERRRNKLQVINEERTELEKEFKVLTQKTGKKEEDEDEEVEEHQGEITLENRTEYLLKPKSKKKIKIGPNYQAVVLPLVILDPSEYKPRMFKSVHNPNEIDQEKFNTIAESANNVLNPDSYNQDFVFRVLRKTHLDYEKTASILKCNEYFFSNLMRVKNVPNLPKKVVQPQEMVEEIAVKLEAPAL